MAEQLALTLPFDSSFFFFFFLLLVHLFIHYLPSSGSLHTMPHVLQTLSIPLSLLGNGIYSKPQVVAMSTVFKLLHAKTSQRTKDS